jgi:hypothetical protein
MDGWRYDRNRAGLHHLFLFCPDLFPAGIAGLATLKDLRFSIDDFRLSGFTPTLAFQFSIAEKGPFFVETNGHRVPEVLLIIPKEGMAKMPFSWGRSKGKAGMVAGWTTTSGRPLQNRDFLQVISGT